MVDVAAILEEVFGAETPAKRCVLGARVSDSNKSLRKQTFPSTPAGHAKHTDHESVSGPEAGCARETVSFQELASPDTRTRRTHSFQTNDATGAPEVVDLPAFHERVAIAEHDGALTRHDAEALAAREQGFTDAEAIYTASVARWAREIDRLAELGAVGPEGAEALKRAQAFIRDGWALQAARLGWGEVGLFGVSPEASWRHLDAMGAAFGGGVQAVTEDAIVHVGGRRFYRATADREGTAPIWETGT